MSYKLQEQIDIIEAFKNNKTIAYRVTIFEGFNYWRYLTVSEYPEHQFDFVNREYKLV